MTNVKGTALVATLRFLNETLGPEATKTILGEVSAEDRNILESIIASGWYPYELLVRLMRAAKKHAGPRANDLYKQMGRASADYGLTGIYKVFFKLGSPHFIISKAPSVMKTYYTTGEATSLLSEKGHAIIECSKFEGHTPEFCERLEGWMYRTLELSGAQQPKIVHEKCMSRGDGVCRFEGWWT